MDAEKLKTAINCWKEECKTSIRIKCSKCNVYKV